MHRGTLMILKRLLAAALGALGLGALAAGSAFAQGQTPGLGNIPAPDVYDDQITCTTNLPSTMGRTPTVAPPSGMSALDIAIGMGTAKIMAKDSDTDPDGTYENLVWVIPPMGANCGGATIMTPFNTVTDIMGTPGDPSDDDVGEGSIATDVAHGYSAVLDKYVDVYGAPGDTTSTGTAGALAAAQKSLNTAIENGQSGAALTPLQNAVNEAQDTHNKAKAAFDDVASGPIYQAGVAEWMAKAAVTKSIMDYNTQVEKTNMALADLDELAYRSYVPLGLDNLVGDAAAENPVSIDATGMATVNLMALINYANADLNDPHVATVDSMTGVTVSTDSNFDAAGNLIVPMSLQDHDNDAGTEEVLRPTLDQAGTNNLVSAIRTRRDNYNTAAAALEKLAADNLNPNLQNVYDEAARRARAEANYYSQAYSTMLSDRTNLNGTFDSDGTFTPTEDVDGTAIDESAAHSIASRNAAYTTENNKRFLAETDLRAKAAAREAATAHVVASFTSPTAFYQQLVDRRQALKVAADRRVAAVTADGGTAPKSLTDAVAAAQKSLDAATKTNNDIQAQFADENDPTLALVQSLLKTGGDDGQALVDAISAVYNTASDAVDDLTGEGGAVAMNTADIEVLDGRVTQNETDIATNKKNIATNAANISTNAENIATNAENIATNVENIDMNAEDIITNAGNIMENRGMIESNTTNIMALQGTVSSNTAAISTNSANIHRNAESIQTIRAGIAASMALAGMPEIGDRGVAVGAGSYDGETALAVGVHFSGENSRFKIGITSADGETGASVGAGWSF